MCEQNATEYYKRFKCEISIRFNQLRKIKIIMLNKLKLKMGEYMQMYPMMQCA